MIGKGSTKKGDFRDWFVSFVGSYEEEGRLHPLLELKRDHSLRVAALARQIAGEIGTDVEEAEAVGLLHDAGRFPQYRDYGTFYDALSVDHGCLGRTVIEGALDRGELALDGKLRLPLLTAVEHHNDLALPEGLDGTALVLASLVRDADKVDIFSVVRHWFEAGRAGELLPRLEPEGNLSPGLLEEWDREGRLTHRHIRTLSDFLVLQLSWIDDVNYAPALALLVERGNLDWIAARLPDEGRTVALGTVERARSRIAGTF
ncbi:HD domain-containing protein [Aminirod propionatiphilus]|uniref:HD domain-containing protein n=1 Tax=Aminirod propionatiphilus TaxID=3415223 RepID=A0ACD1DY76_9BACT|nr:HD domain-containing protein [Synergistota bacterium]